MQTNYRIIVDKTTGDPKCFAVHSGVIPVGESSEIARAECGHRAGGPRRFSPRGPVGHRHSAQTLLIAIPAIKAQHGKRSDLQLLSTWTAASNSGDLPRRSQRNS